MNMKSNTVASCGIYRLKIPINLSITDETKATAHHHFSSDALFAIIKSPDITIDNAIGKNLMRHNVFDYSCLHKEPNESAFHQLLAFALMYRSEVKEPIIKCDTTASLICDQLSEGFLQELSRSGTSLEKSGNGIYHTYDMMVNVSVIVLSELGKTEQSWLESVIQSSDKCPEIRIDCPNCQMNTHTL